MEITVPAAQLEAWLDNPLLNAVLEQSSDGAIVIDARTRTILRMNRRARELLGYAEKDAVGCRCAETMNAPDCTVACPLTAQLAGRAEDNNVQLLYRGRNGDQLLHAQTRMLVVRDEHGQPLAGIELFRDLTEHRKLEQALHQRRSLHGIIGQAEAMQSLYELVAQIAPYELPVLITGESGVGKERFADAIQYLSDRSDSPFVKVNCAALNASLIESELFGHCRGAFTGASTDRRGSFEEADGGTLLLDEVGELPLNLQAKLLRVIQSGELQRVGEDRRRHVDVRVLAATNRDMEGDVANGHFREDLYYRLAGARVHVPPLRERISDVPLLAEHFLDAFAAESERRGRVKPAPMLSDSAHKELLSRDWRGNVRELQNVLRLAWIRVPIGHELRAEHLSSGPRSPRLAAPASLAEMEHQAITRAMNRSGGNVSGAARLLGIDRSTLWRKLKKTGAG